jgi:hypothetical protein
VVVSATEEIPINTSLICWVENSLGTAKFHLCHSKTEP